MHDFVVRGLGEHLADGLGALAADALDLFGRIIAQAAPIRLPSRD